MVSVELSLNAVVLTGNFFFRVGVTKSLGISSLSFDVSEMQRDSCWEALSPATLKSVSDGLLEKLSTASLLAGVSSSQIVGEEFFVLLNSVSVEPILNAMVLIGNFFQCVGAAKSSFMTSLLFGVSLFPIGLFWDVFVLRLFLEVVNKLLCNKEFYDSHGMKSLTRVTRCYKNPGNPTGISLMLPSANRIFQNFHNTGQSISVFPSQFLAFRYY